MIILDVNMPSSGAAPADAGRINKRGAFQRLKSLGQLITSTRESLKPAQIELRNLLNGKIVLSAEDTGEFYRVRGLIKAKLSAFLPQPSSVMVYGGLPPFSLTPG
jgi:hypothetical protein